MSTSTLISFLAPAFAPSAARVLSPLQVNTFLDCQARWYYSHELELPDPPTGSLALGKAVHHVVRLLLLSKAEIEARGITDTELLETMSSALRVELNQAELRPDEDAAALEADAIALIQLLARDVAPSIDAAALELEVHGRIGNQHVRGFVDVIQADGCIVDLKTAAKAPGEISASYKLQFATYGLLTGKPQCRLITLIRTKTPKWKQHTLNTHAGANFQMRRNSQAMRT